MLIIVSSLNIEVKYLIKKLHLNLVEKKNSRQSIYFKNNIYGVITGIGWKNEKKMLNYFFDKYNISIDDKFILIGIAGAIDENLKVGDILNPGIIQNRDKSVKISDNYRILYDDNKPFFKEDKDLLKEKFSKVTAVDMESFQFVNLMKQYKVKDYKVIKVISDIAGTDVPAFNDFTAKLRDIGIKKYFKVIKFKHNVKKAVNKLGKYLYKSILKNYKIRNRKYGKNKFNKDR